MAKRLLIVDQVSTNRIRLAATLSAAHYDAETASSFEEVPGAELEPDVIVLGTHSDHPAEVIAELQNAPSKFGKVPLLCVDADASPLRRLHALRAGAREILSRSLLDTLLLARLRSMIRESDTVRECERRRVAAASFGFAEAASDFQPSFRIGCLGEQSKCSPIVELLGAILSHKVEHLAPEDVLREDASRHSPDAYVIFSETSHDLETLLPELRERSHLRHASVLVLYPDGANKVIN